MNGSDCLASYFAIDVDGKRMVHQYDVKIEYSQDGRGVTEMTDRANDLTKMKNRKIVDLVMDGKIMKGKSFIYNSMRQLFTSFKMDEINGHRINKDDLPLEIRDSFYGSGIVEVNITENAKIPSFDLSDWSQYDRKDVWQNEDRILRNFFEVLTTYPAVCRGFLPIKGNLYGPPENFSSGLFVRPGVKKGVQFIQSGSKVRPVLSLDSIKKVFFPNDANFLETVQQFCQGGHSLEQAEKLFKNVKLRSKMNPARSMAFKGFGKPVSQCTADVDGKSMTLTEFYLKYKKITLKAAELPVALMAGVKGDFPLELLEIVLNQPVPTNRLPPKLEQQQKKLNIVHSPERYQSILTVLGNLELNNATTRAFGVSIQQKMTPVRFEKLPFPHAIMMFRNKPAQVNSDDNGGLRLRSEHFLVSANIGKWAVIYNRKDSVVISKFTNQLQEAAARRGLDLKNVVQYNVGTTNLNYIEWEKIFQRLKYSDGVHFFMIVDELQNNHYEIKATEMLIPSIVTQQVAFSTAFDIVNKNKRWMLDNLVYKINLKAGGLNCGVKLNEAAKDLDLEQPILVIGLDVNHPTGENYIGPQTQPSVVGFAANYGKQPCAFMGDYFFQEPRNESINVEMLQTFTERAVRSFNANRGEPRRVIVLRDGVSEGQYADVIDKELQAVRNGVAKLCKKRPQFTLIVLTKTHVVRHFLAAPEIRSLAPGTFIDDGARKGLMQFYFAAHRAIQGTSQDLLATVLVNECNVSKLCIQHFLHGLCHLHELSGTPVSLPEPVYQADALAGRGCEMFKVLNNREVDPSNYAGLTARLSYGKDQLPNKRFAA